MNTINGLPLYKATLSDEEEGMFMISLVDDPATESNFLAFSNNDKVMTFSVADEEKRMVRGLVMSCDTPIYRIGPSGYEFYVYYDAETLRHMVERFLRNGFQNNVDTMHNYQIEDGVYLQEIFIKDVANGINPKGFEDIKDGSVFAQYHVVNDEVWNRIKSGEFKGFSLAGEFDVVPAEEENDAEFDECVNLIEKINKRINRIRK